MKHQKLDSLQKRCLQYLRNNSYSESTVQKIVSRWKNGINSYCRSNDLSDYYPDIGEKFLESISTQRISKCYYNDYLKSIRVLDDILLFGKINSHKATSKEYDFIGIIGTEMLKFIKYMKERNLRPYTITEYKRILSAFLDVLKINGVTRVEDISEDTVVSYIDSIQINRNQYVQKLRKLFGYWKSKGLLDKGIKEALDTIRISTKEPIPSYFSPQEVYEIESSVDRISAKGKRDYAMMLLASRLGLRVSDIVNLKLADIDWDKSKIAITMYKTHKNIELPLLADVGNAIIDYLRNARPKSNLRYVFLKETAPYNEMSIGCVYSAFNVAIRKSQIHIDNRHHGPHAFRHSLASELLNKGTSLPVISDVLGHKSSETTMSYLKIDINKLMVCALSVPLVHEDFYTQKGGIFYD